MGIGKPLQKKGLGSEGAKVDQCHDWRRFGYAVSCRNWFEKARLTHRKTLHEGLRNDC